MAKRAEDTLLQCLLALCRYHGNGSTAEALTGGLPLEDGRLNPSLFERAATRVGLTARIVFKSPEKVESSLLPAVVLLNNDRACLLMGWSDDGTLARVVFPDILDAVVEIPAGRLQEDCTGSVIVCRPRFRFDSPAPGTGDGDGGHWFWTAVRNNIPIYKDVLIAAFFINLFGLALPIFIRVVYDRVIPNFAVETLWMLAVGVIIILFADALLRTMRSYFVDLASRRVDVTVSASIMEQVLGQRLEHRPASVGSYAVSLRSFESVRDFIASSTVTAIVDLPFALIFIAVIGIIAWQMLLPIAIGLAIIICYAWFTQNKLRSISETVYRASAQRNATLVEGLVGLETIKSMGAETRLQRKWEETTVFLANVGTQLRLVSNATINVTLFVQHMVSVFMIITGVYLINDGLLSMGGLIACNLLSNRAMGPFSRAAGLMAQYHNAGVAMKSLDEVMARPLERPEGAQFLSREMFRGDIEFKNVSFSYPQSEMESLSDVSFKVKAGEHVAILGRVGSGKTTLEKLCMGLFQPTSGAVMIDGIDLRQLDPTEFRSRVGYVPQDITLFHGSLRENIALEHHNVSDSDLVNAAEMAGLSEFVNRHPAGFDMLVSERGDSLSGGQRKSVALARAVVHEPPILLMDEPTGSMDHSTEKFVKDQLRTFIEGRTWLVVTHRNSLLEMVDRIIVIDNGKLVADGPRDQVVQALQQGRIGKSQ